MGKLLTYHEWAEQAGYKRNDNWLKLPDAKKMMRRRDKLLDKEVQLFLTDEEKLELEAYDKYWLYAFEYGFNTFEEVIKFQSGYFEALFGKSLPETQKAIKMFETDEYEKLNSLSKYITDKNWKTK